MEGELQPVLKSLRGSGINIVAIHSHMEAESPKILFLHYWGIGLTDGEAQTGPIALPSGIGAVEAIEDLEQVLRWDTGSRVGDDNLCVAIYTVKLERYLFLFRRVLQGIVEQVKQQSPQALGLLEMEAVAPAKGMRCQRAVAVQCATWS